MSAKSTVEPLINANPLSFENLANCLATVGAQFHDLEDNIGLMINEYERLFNKALQSPPSYLEVTELAGEGASPNDRYAGRGAWLLMNAQNLDILAVHAQAWEKGEKGKGVRAPILSILSKRLNLESKLSLADLQERGVRATKNKKVGKLGILAVKNGAVWLVQAVSHDEFAMKTGLFEQSTFNEPVLSGKHLATLHDAHWLVSSAFPGVEVKSLVLVLHSQLIDKFDLYEVSLPRTLPLEIILTNSQVIDSSLNHQKQLEENSEALICLPARLNNKLFRGLPPCRGSRTLCTLAALAIQQLDSPDLLHWSESQVGNVYRSTFGFQVSRDKMRHDLCDRLIAQWFMKRRGSVHYLTIQGLARYLYCLKKYTSEGPKNPMDVIEICIAHCKKILAKYGAI